MYDWNYSKLHDKQRSYTINPFNYNTISPMHGSTAQHIQIVTSLPDHTWSQRKLNTNQ